MPNISLLKFTTTKLKVIVTLNNYKSPASQFLTKTILKKVDVGTASLGRHCMYHLKCCKIIVLCLPLIYGLLE
jgi:hypothetical protein